MAVTNQLLRPRVLSIAFFAILVWPAAFHGLRPPLSRDISGFELPLCGELSGGRSSVESPLVDCRPRWFSPGMMLLAAGVVCGLLTLRQPKRFSLAAGLMLAVFLAADASIVLNHPHVVDHLDRELQLRGQLVELLRETADPEVDVMTFSRVSINRADGQRGSLWRGLAYVPTGRWTFLAMAAVAVFLATRGPVPRRAAFTLAWIAVGLVLAGGVCWRRVAAQWHWIQAVKAESRGELQRADHLARRSLDVLPTSLGVERTWQLRGKIDYLQGLDSAVARYYVGAQWARNGRFEEAAAALEDGARFDSDVAGTSGWHADIISQLALEMFRRGNAGAAEAAWSRAMRLDRSLPQYQLAVAILASRGESRQPQVVAQLVDPLLPGLADRALRASLLAMTADCYFEAGQFAEARWRYQQSLAIYSLPKRINYQALRGLVGM